MPTHRLTAPTSEKPHIVWLDVVRLIAMVSVVCCHAADPFNFYPDEAPADLLADIKWWGAAYGSLMRPCVPLFVMLTGALLLPVRTESAPFYKKRIGRVLWPFLVWSLIYNLFPWFTGVLGFSPRVILDFFPYSGEEAMRQSLRVSMQYIAGIPVNFSLLAVHMWYIYLLIGIYLYLPIFSAWVSQASERSKRLFLLLWGITTLLPYYFHFVSPYIWGGCSWNAYPALYYFAGFNGYLLLGHYLRHHDYTLRQTLVGGLLLFAVGYAVTLAGFRSMTARPGFTDADMELFFTYCSLNVVCMTIPLFLLAKHVKIRSPRIRQWLSYLTTCGFGIYMIHYFFTGPAVLLTRALHLPLGLQIPVAGVLAFGVSWLLVHLLRLLFGRFARYVVG